MQKRTIRPIGFHSKCDLAALGDLRPGSLSIQYNVCGSPGCRCKADPPVKHGPYYQVSYTRKSSTKPWVIPQILSYQIMLLIAVCCPEFGLWMLDNIVLSMASFGRSKTRGMPQSQLASHTTAEPRPRLLRCWCERGRRLPASGWQSR